MENVRENKKFGVQYSYILDRMQNADNPDMKMDDCAKVVYFFSKFNSEYNSPRDKKFCPNCQKRVASYLQGLPSCINIDFTNYDIIQVGKSWGMCKNSTLEEEFLNTWFDRIAQRILQLGINFKIIDKDGNII